MHSNARHSHQVWKKEIDGVEHILWTAACSEGGQYIAVFNTGDKGSKVEIPLADVEIYDAVTATELWSGETAAAEKSVSVKLNSHGAKAFLLK